MVFSMNELSHAASSQTMLYQDFRFEDYVSYLLLCAKLGNGQRIPFFFFVLGHYCILLSSPRLIRNIPRVKGIVTAAAKCGFCEVI